MILRIRLTALALLLAVSTTFAQSSDTLVIAYYESPPFIVKKDNSLDGVSVWLWNAISEDLNITPKYVEVGLDGILHGLADSSIDMSLAPLTITSDRSKKFDFSTPFYIANSTILVRSKTSLQKAMQFVSSFFSLNFLRAAAALFVVVFIFGFFAWLFERKENPEEFGSGIKGLWQGLWWSAVTMTTVGYGDKSPKTVGGRVVALVWMFAAIIIISGFTASIASSLTVNQLAWNQNQIADFKEKQLGTVGASATERWLQTNFYREVSDYSSLPDGIGGLRAGEVEAVAYDEPLLQYMVQSDSLGEFEILPIKYNLQLYAYGFSDQVPQSLKEQVSIRLLEVVESTDWQVLLSEYGLLNK